MILRYNPKTAKTLCAIDAVRVYWQRQADLIQTAEHAEERDRLQRLSASGPAEQEEYTLERYLALELQETVVNPMLRYSCIVMLYTTAERELRRLVENIAAERQIPTLENSNTRPKPFLKQIYLYVDRHLRLNLSDCPHYHSICDLQKIRDCIIHCRGEAALSRDKDHLLRLSTQLPGFFAISEIDIRIEEPCIEQFGRDTWAFFTWIFQRLNWTIDEHWQRSIWGQPSPRANSGKP